MSKSLLCVLSRKRQQYTVPERSSGQTDPRAHGARPARPSYTDGRSRLLFLDSIFIIHSEAQLHVRLTPYLKFENIGRPDSAILRKFCSSVLGLMDREWED
jgi:hypothetical protein